MSDRASVTWARNDLRRRWKALVVLGVLAGITAGFALAALAGARRTDSAVPRLRAATSAPDAIVFSGQVGAYHPDWDALRARPEVADVAVWNLLFGNADGEPGALFFAAEDDGYLGRLNAPVVLAGRMWDPEAADEVVVTRTMSKDMPLDSTVTFQSFGAEQGDSDTEPTGPTVTFRVVGVVKTVNEFLFAPDQVFVGPGFVAQHAGEVQLIENADVRLRNGAADVPALQRDVSEVVAPGTPVLDLHAVSRRVETTLRVEHAALLLLALAVAVAGGVLVAQAVRRSASVIEDDVLVLRAIGSTPANITAAATLPHGLTGFTAVVVAIVTMIGASIVFPIGLGRRIDPDIGFHVDWPVLAGGVALVAVFVLGGAMLVANRVARSARVSAAHPSRFAAAVRAHTPVPIGLGTGMALERGSGPRRVPVRPALLGAVVGVLGVVAMLTVDHAIDDALRHPERAGVTWDATVVPSPADYEENGLAPGLLDAVRDAAPAGSSMSSSARLVVPVDGVGVPTFSLDTLAVTTAAGAAGSRTARPISLALTAGRAPGVEGEGALGPKTARDLHVGVGDTVAFGEQGLPMRIVGLALFPPDVHAEFDEGIWVTKSQLDAVNPVVSPDELYTGAERAVLVRYPPGTDEAAATELFAQRLAGRADAMPAEVPVELTNLRNVRVLPILLAAFLALLAVAAVSHVLATSARVRRRDLAVLRALGLDRRGTRLALFAQATTIGVVGLVVGIPVGIVAARASWRWLADNVPLEVVPPFSVLVVGATMLGAVVLVNALAVWPGRRAARLKLGEVLRTE